MTTVLSPESDTKTRVSVEEVTPETARRWLGRNQGNRTLRSKSLVRDYAQTMKNGRWAFTGEPIQFAPDGRLLNGQHRLSAVILANVTLPFLVVRNLPAEAQRYMDSGAKRTVADALTMDGRDVDTKNIAAIARGAILYSEDRRPTRDEIIEYADSRLEELITAARVAVQVRQKLRNGVAVYGVAFIQCARIDPDGAHFFFEKLRTGEHLAQHDPIKVLRERCLQGLAPGSNEQSLMYNLGLIFKCWNAWRTGREIKTLRFTFAESFPEPK